jgi:hypothetical protein
MWEGRLGLRFASMARLLGFWLLSECGSKSYWGNSGLGRRHGEGNVNPLRWKREHQIAFWLAVVLGGSMGIAVGLQRVGPSASVLWGVVGAVMAGAGAYVRQMLRNRNSN